MALGSLIQDWKVSFCLVLEDQLGNFLLYRDHDAACINILWATPNKYVLFSQSSAFELVLIYSDFCEVICGANYAQILVDCPARSAPTVCRIDALALSYHSNSCMYLCT